MEDKLMHRAAGRIFSALLEVVISNLPGIDQETTRALHPQEDHGADKTALTRTKRSERRVHISRYSAEPAQDGETAPNAELREQFT